MLLGKMIAMEKKTTYEPPVAAVIELNMEGGIMSDSQLTREDYILTIVALTCLLSACTREVETEAIMEVPVYQVCIPASFEAGAPSSRAVTFDGTVCVSSFKTTENVYVYNITTEKILKTPLHPSELSADGKS